MDKKTATVTFTERELQYLTGQRLGRIATASLVIQPIQPHVCMCD
jgi:hypothetical protein